VLFNLTIAVPSLLGLLLGVQIVIEGVTLLVAGRLRPGPVAAR
jgi:membrane protein HdeD